MKLIPLTQEKFAIVDDEDYVNISSRKWYAKINRLGYMCYANRKSGTAKKRVSILMHREILQALPHQDVDHINGDSLDNRRSNLRLCSTSQNGCNRGKQRNNTSGHKGVVWDSDRLKWRAQIKLHRKCTNLGRFNTIEEAKAAYARAAAALHQDFAKL